MEAKNLIYVARVHAETFPRQTLSREWISCNFNAFPRIRYYLAEINRELLAIFNGLRKVDFAKKLF